MVVVEIGGITTPLIYMEMVTNSSKGRDNTLRSQDKFYIRCFKYKRYRYYRVLILNKIVK